MTEQATQTALAAYFPLGRWARALSFQLRNDLLHDGVVTVPLGGLEQHDGAVGDERVVAVGREKLTLLGAVAGKWLVTLDCAYDQAAGDVLGLAASGERDKGNFGDLGIGDLVAPPWTLSSSSQMAWGYLMLCEASWSMLAIATVTVLVIRAVTEYQVLARIAAPTNARP